MFVNFKLGHFTYINLLIDITVNLRMVVAAALFSFGNLKNKISLQGLGARITKSKKS